MTRTGIFLEVECLVCKRKELSLSQEDYDVTDSIEIYNIKERFRKTGWRIFKMLIEDSYKEYVVCPKCLPEYNEKHKIGKIVYYYAPVAKKIKTFRILSEVYEKSGKVYRRVSPYKHNMESSKNYEYEDALLFDSLKELVEAQERLIISRQEKINKEIYEDCLIFQKVVEEFLNDNS